MAFGVIGVGNVLLYLLIFNVTLSIGAVKATIIATVVTTTVSYVANRHWTYKSRPKSTLRREYTLFFAFNLVGMVIQAGMVGAAKYGLGLSESQDRLALNIATCVGIAVATVFRFWAYRTFVFRPHPAVAEVIAATLPVTPLVEPETPSTPPRMRRGADRSSAPDGPTTMDAADLASAARPDRRSGS